MTLKEKYTKRRQLTEESRKLVDKAAEEKRPMTAEENARFDTIFSDINSLGVDIEKEEKLLSVERSIQENIFENEERAGNTKPTNTEKRDLSTILMDATRSFLLTGEVPEEDFAEWRSLQAGSDSQGGYMVVAEQFVNNLIKFIDDSVVIRQLANTFSVPNAESLGAVSLDNDPDDADWTTELSTGSEDTAMSFGKRNLHPHPFAKRIKISNTLLRKGFMGSEQLVLSRLGYKAGITEEKGYITGSGAGQPLGIMVASPNGISTARDVSTGNTTTSPTFDGLISAFYALKAGYHNNATWGFHRDVMAAVAKLKDGEGQYIWRPSVVENRPDTILGRPMFLSEFMPNTMTTGQYVGIIGDFSHYWIADALDLQIKRLGELYAESDQTGYIMRKESDGMPVLEEAFVRVKLG